MSIFNTFPNYDTISAGTALSAGVFLNGNHPVRLVMPAGWNAAVMTLQESPDSNGGQPPLSASYQSLYDQLGAEIALTVAAARNIVIPTSLLPGAQWLRLRSGTTAAPVNQTSTRTIILYVRKYGGLICPISP